MDLSSSPHLLFLLKKFYRFSRTQAPDGRQHPYGSDNLTQHPSINPYLPHYRVAFASSVISPSTSISLPYG